MSDPEGERLNVRNPMAISTNTSSFSCMTMAPPFAPQPHYALNVSDVDGTCRTTSTSTGRSGTIITRNYQNQLTKQNRCGFHRVCGYLQQVIFISAIITGVALVIAGGVLHSQSGDLVVFVYIGVLLIGVNSALLAIQCFVHRKQNERHRTCASSRQSNPCSNACSSAPQYTSVNTKPPSLQVTNVGPVNEEGCVYMGQMSYVPSNDYASPAQAAQSPTESRIKYFSSMHSMVSYRQGSLVGQGHHYHHYHHSKDKFHHSPPQNNQQASSRKMNSLVANNPSQNFLPASSCNELIGSSGKRNGTTVHLI